MKLGAFSISLNIEDINASKEFYEKLGFSQFGGDLNQGWLILKNDQTLIGLFQGMLPSNVLTFNPGWNQEAGEVNPFEDIRAIQAKLESAGIEFESKVEASEGPGHFLIKDPDGNVIMLDQHR